MTNTKNVLRAIVIMPELLLTVEEKRGLERWQVKYLLAAWMISRTNYHYTAKELLQISNQFTPLKTNEMVELKYIEVAYKKVVGVGGAPTKFYKITGKGMVLVNYINDLAGILPAKRGGSPFLRQMGQAGQLLLGVLGP